jgi:D-alanyl-lipoteichoic acid acyltransferase DltB (MBOAT superfamily)
MLFNSLEFFLFFLIVTPLYFLLPHRWRWLHLLIASCVFYCAFIPVYILILFFTIIVDYVAGILIEQAPTERKKAFLVMSLIANIGVLAVFKYYNFFTENINLLLAQLHIVTHPLPLLKIILPIGLSFHTFQAMSYTIEVYRGNQKAERHFGIYALYVMFYPQLVAGPIERPQNMLHQFHEEHSFSWENLLGGLRLILWGLFKKVVIADRLAVFVNGVFQAPENYSALNIIVALFFFAYQIYCDFSGYSDIALGSAQVMGFKLMRNFNHPFHSKNITEFWRRWHISLSTWFNDYLFNPFIIAFRDWGKTAVVLGLLITFFISGVWHGAGWNFIVFGLLHGLAMVYEFLTKKQRSRASKKIPSFIYNPVSQVLTFVFLLFAWIFFRAPDFTTASVVVHKIFTPETGYFALKTVKSFGSLSLLTALASIVFLLFLDRKLEPELLWFNDKPKLDFAICTFLLLMVVCLGVFSKQSFIYFQF